MKCLLTLVALSTTHGLVRAQSPLGNPDDSRCGDASSLARRFMPLATLIAIPCLATAQWNGYAHDPQHTAVSGAAAQPLTKIRWQTPIDTNTPGGELFVHYGSISITSGNTVLVPVKTVAADGLTINFKVLPFNGATGASLGYVLNTDYTLPTQYATYSETTWTPPFTPALSLNTRLYYAGAGGTVYYRDTLSGAKGSNGLPGATGQYVFYGKSVYTPANQANLNATIQISTPITADRYGDIFFGFVAAAGNGAGVNGADIVSGLARIGPTGVGSWVSAKSLAGGDPGVTQVAQNCAPALSNDQRTVYVALSGGGIFDTNGYLASLNATNLAPIANVQLFDPRTPPGPGGTRATVSGDSSASPMVGPDGDVYYGVLENPCCYSHNDRGWMLHFNSALSTLKTPGSFGWDNTASVVPASIVPSYTGNSTYLILTKYNNYNGIGTGNGINQVGVLDPNGTQTDEYCPSSCSSSPVTVMQEVITVTTSVGTEPSSEWCINTTAIDPFTKSAIINSENGNVYRWDFTTNSLLQVLNLTGGIGEAYTPTVIGPDGTAYAVNDSILFAVGN